MSDETFIKNALASAKYREADKTRREVLATINHYKGLKPISENFVFNNGTQKLLLALKGTIPVHYKGACYHIPIIIWLLDTHPYNAPMVFVNPTPDMRIKVSRHVDHNGKVYLPYLHDWKYNSSELLDLIQVLIITFQEQPPVYAVPPQHQASIPYPTQPWNNTGGSGGGGGTPYPVDMSQMSMPMPGMPMPSLSQPSQQQQGQGTLTPSFSVRPSLISAGEEKLRRRLEDVYLSTEIIKKTGEQLRSGQSKLEMMMARLNDEKRTLEQNIQACEKECATLDGKISNSKSEEQVANLDDAIQAPAPLYKQILNTAAEEAALDDTIYYLGEALRQDKIDLEQYLRTVRQISRKQFTSRALLRKCRQKAGLAG